MLHKEYYHSSNGAVGITRSNVNDAWAGDSDTRPRGFVFGGNDKGIYFRKIDGRIGRNKAWLSDLDLFDDVSTYEYLFNLKNVGSLAVVGDDVWVIRNSGNASGNATINIDKYIAANNWEMQTETITVTAPLHASSWNLTFAVIGDYLYMCGYNNDGVYKINLSNLADVTKIEVSVPSACLYAFGDLVSSRECFIDPFDQVHLTGIKSAPCYRYGPWAILSQGTHSAELQCFFRLQYLCLT